jgi:undecaprenol kinase
MIKIKRLRKSFVYAFRGLVKMIREEQNFRVHIFFAAASAVLGALMGISRIEWCLLAVVIGMVFLMEAVNSAVERITDVLRPRINDYAKEIKDITAAAVMISSILAVIVGLLIFVPRLISLN